MKPGCPGQLAYGRVVAVGSVIDGATGTTGRWQESRRRRRVSLPARRRFLRPSRAGEARRTSGSSLLPSCRWALSAHGGPGPPTQMRGSRGRIHSIGWCPGMARQRRTCGDRVRWHGAHQLAEAPVRTPRSSKHVGTGGRRRWIWIGSTVHVVSTRDETPRYKRVLPIIIALPLPSSSPSKVTAVELDPRVPFVFRRPLSGHGYCALFSFHGPSSKAANKQIDGRAHTRASTDIDVEIFVFFCFILSIVLSCHLIVAS